MKALWPSKDGTQIFADPFHPFLEENFHTDDEGGLMKATEKSGRDFQGSLVV